ncbi:MAG TPA: aminodeoxychorismate synthase component I [Armatimonadota bacterium]|jgi:para-aminobenzoate synthetase/4-amino-4-deoxychorismate lyase
MNMSDLTALLNLPGSALFCGPETWLPGSRALLLHEPERVLLATDPAEVPPLLAEAQRRIAGGAWVAGYLAYEAGAAYELPTPPASATLPLAWLACYPAEHVQEVPAELLRALPVPDTLPPVEVALNVTEAQYRAAIERIKELLASGDTYQVNYTCRARFTLDLDPLAYFLALTRSHPVPYAAYLNLGETQVLSLSPELFLERRGEVLASRPMKGTRRRGRTAEEDEALRAELVGSEKDRAENLMIVDMVRNDLGRLCRAGSVAAPRLFSAEKYDTVWQMTGTVTGCLPAGVGLPEIIAATFPGASITGAPQRRTMEIIRDLEPEARGVYTGALGLFRPGGDFVANLPIRTLVHRAGAYELGIGGGIVWDSAADSEYEEALLKASFALRLQPELRLFETLLLTEAREYRYLAEHWARLAGSAAYWDFPLDPERVASALATVAAEAAGLPLVVRLELDRSGQVTVIPRPLPEPPTGPVRVLLSPEATDSNDRLLYHKTTQRRRYDEQRAAALAAGFYEVIFRNQRESLTEGAVTNLFVRTATGWVTPPVLEGLLPGIWREAFRREVEAVERPLSRADLATAQEVVIGNSVRGAVSVDEVCEANGERLWARVVSG